MKNFRTIGLFLSGLFLIFAAVSCKEDVEPPEASFTFSPEPANTEEPVTFEAEESYPGSCENCYITDYYWDFDNDGEWDEITDNSTIIHQFNSSNIYDVVLKVRNNQGYTSVEYATQSVEVQTGSSGDEDGPVSLSFPPDNSDDISLLPKLRWSVDNGSDFRFDVYLGTSENPGIVAEELEDTSFTPTDSLEKNTTYYWRVEAHDEEDSDESSPLWEFTTQETDEETNKPPNKPTAPYPEPVSENRSLNQFIEWKCSDPNGDELTYEVYFGTSE
ncbi:MAG: PKD domain-containing protein, partial [Bacteroidota bacterium]